MNTIVASSASSLSLTCAAVPPARSQTIEPSRIRTVPMPGPIQAILSFRLKSKLLSLAT